MKGFKAFLQIKVFLGVSLVFILVGLFILATEDKVPIHLAINGVHNSFFDTLFIYWTYLGDGITTSILALFIAIYSFKKYRFSTFILGTITLVFTGIFSQLLKRSFFEDAMRPAKFIGEEMLYLVPNVEIHHAHSFPSGHTTAAFAFCAFATFVLFRKNRIMQVVMAIIAVLIGYSRMYLSQHFLEDVVTGALLGILVYLVAHLITAQLPLKSNIAHSEPSVD